MQNKLFSDYIHNEYFPIQAKINFDSVITEFEGFYTSSLLAKNIPFFNNIEQAFIHRSMENESGRKLKCNEKLEFLGDAVLELMVSQRLFSQYTSKKEGELSKLRSAIVNETILSEISLFLGLDRLLILGKGEFQEKGYQKSSILADCFEALLGVMHLNLGLEETTKFYFKIVDAFSHEKKGFDIFSEEILIEFDAKSKLQELTMKKYKSVPQYIFEEQNGQFLAKCFIGDKLYGEAIGTSKKKAVQNVAKNVFKKIQ